MFYKASQTPDKWRTNVKKDIKSFNFNGPPLVFSLTGLVNNYKRD